MAGEQDIGEKGRRNGDSAGEKDRNDNDVTLIGNEQLETIAEEGKDGEKEGEGNGEGEQGENGGKDADSEAVAG